MSDCCPLGYLLKEKSEKDTGHTETGFYIVFFQEVLVKHWRMKMDQYLGQGELDRSVICKHFLITVMGTYLCNILHFSWL